MDRVDSDATTNGGVKFLLRASTEHIHIAFNVAAQCADERCHQHFQTFCGEGTGAMHSDHRLARACSPGDS